MDPNVPLGQRETSTLEFKSAEALRNLPSISREVVAMLNHLGGEVWIGLRENDGIASAAEGIESPDEARINVLNHLIEVIEPRIDVPGDLTLDVVGSGDKALLLISIENREAKRPFAQLRGGGRHFLVRVDHRIRPMTREELFSAARSPRDSGTPKRLPDLRAKALGNEQPGLWVGFEASPEVSLELQDPALSRLLLDPRVTGNRLSGWNFRYPPGHGVEPELGARRLEFGRAEYRKTTVWEDGCVEFFAPLDRLQRRATTEQEIHALALLEFPVSIARLTRALYSEESVTKGAPSKVFADTVLTGAAGWRLPSNPPGTIGYSLDDDPHGELTDGTFSLLSPYAFPWSEFRDRPDRAGYMLVRSIYQAFGLGEEWIPYQYDRKLDGLVLED